MMTMISLIKLYLATVSNLLPSLLSLLARHLTTLSLPRTENDSFNFKAMDKGHSNAPSTGDLYSPYQVQGNSPEPKVGRQKMRRHTEQVTPAFIGKGSGSESEFTLNSALIRKSKLNQSPLSSQYAKKGRQSSIKAMNGAPKSKVFLVKKLLQR